MYLTNHGTISEPMRLRMLHGWSQEELADLIHVSYRTIYAFESGPGASLTIVGLIADALGTTVEKIAVVSTRRSLVARTMTPAEAYKSLCNRCGRWSP